jgi:hypothetical protein
MSAPIGRRTAMLTVAGGLVTGDGARAGYRISRGGYYRRQAAQRGGWWRQLLQGYPLRRLHRRVEPLPAAGPRRTLGDAQKLPLQGGGLGEMV